MQSEESLVALPWVDFYRREIRTDEYDEYDGVSTWTPNAMEWGKKYVKFRRSDSDKPK